ncbi:MAG: RagB/SusD family nutrient uptake outer membrane protein [Fermentimonas sp.]|jgi:hypothetical protein
MKKRYTLINLLTISAVLLSIILAGCSDFLDKLPENTVAEEEVDYTKIDEMYMPVSGVYATAANKMSFWGGYGLISVRGDDVVKGSAPNDQVEFNYADKFEYEKISGFWALNATWENLYKIITTANAALESLDKYKESITSTADTEKYNQYTAEVRFLRAMAFYRVTMLWGAAPLLIDNQALTITKNSIEEVHSFIQDEMDYCIENLPALRPNEVANKPGAVTKYTALMLKAKLALFDGDYETVLSATQQIIDSNKFSLYPDYYQLFKIPGKLSNESLYELQFTDFNTGSGDIVTSDAWFAFQGPRGGITPIQGWGFMVPSQGIRDFLNERGDNIRIKTTLLYTGKTTPSGDVIPLGNPGEPDCYSGKAYTPSNQMTEGRTGYGMNNNIRIFRYADVLLMNAEAKVRSGQNGDAPFNMVRARVEMEPITNVTIDQILDERRAEFALEWGERYTDLVRTGKAAEVLDGFIAGVSEYYPIPQNQIDLNPDLK